MMHGRKAREPVEDPDEAVRRAEVQVIEVALEPMLRRQLLGHEQVSRRKVHAHLQAEAATGIWRGVDPHVALAQQLTQGFSADAVDHLE